jgi:hypothetical protein
MKVSKSYKLSEFLVWTRRKVYVVLALAIVPVAVYQLLGRFTNEDRQTNHSTIDAQLR